MALKEYLLLTIAITISIGISSVFAWNPEIHRYESYDLDRGPVFYEAYYPDSNDEARDNYQDVIYESYDLDRGPVFYEAYYPDSNDEARDNYQEKRFFDRGAVLEKTYQVPAQRLVYPNNVVQLNSRQSLPQGDRFPPGSNEQSLDIKEISSLARRAISRDLENWNTLENYLHRAKYQDPSYRRQMVVPDPVYEIERSVRGQGLDSLKNGRDPRQELYEEVREQPADLTSRLRLDDESILNLMRRLTTRDLTNKDSMGAAGSTRYQNQPEQETVGTRGPSKTNVPSLKDQRDSGSMAEPYPSENIFAPRPQVINYIFSKKPVAENKIQSVPDIKEPIKESMPRNYGDNLIQEEMKKISEDKDVKVASIEVSEVPKHKTRHHHGDWPKRDYSRRHQS